MTKKTFTARQILVAVSAIVATVVGIAFLIMYSVSFVNKQTEKIQRPVTNSVVLAPENMGSYGEQMFAYIGKDNYIYNLDDESAPLIAQPAALLLYASDDTVIYTASAETEAQHYGRESVIQELQIGENENALFTIATVTIDPCWSSNDEVVYFVQEQNKRQLYTFEPLTSTTELAAEFEEDITGLRISSDGLLVTVESGKEKLYVPLSKKLTDAYYNSQGCRIIVCEQYDLILSPEGILYYRWLGSTEAEKISEHVFTTVEYQDNQILFIREDSEGLSLCAYYVSEVQTKELARLSENMLPQLTVSADYVFLIDSDFFVYRLSLDTNEMHPFCQIDASVKNPMISVFDYRLMVYDLSKEIDATFAYALDATRVLSETEILDLASLAESKAQDFNEDYAEYQTLEMASIGQEVVDLQTKLSELGYFNQESTGIFDVGTGIAVQYLQEAMGLEPTGIATPAFQYMLYTDAVPEYEGYQALSPSSSGIRVADVQARLRTLGYLVQPVTSSVDENTEKALSCFASQNGFQYTGGVVMPELIDGLFSPNATAYHGHLPLRYGDCSPAVTDFNARLKELGYLAGSVNPSYDDKTAAAVALYATVNGREEVDEVTEDLAEEIYGENAAKCPSEFAPEQINDSSSANESQVISDRQLKIIRKWLTKQFAVNHTDKQAVKRLQMQLVKLGFLKPENVSLIYDQATKDAVAAYQEKNGLNVDGITSKSTLTDIFSKTIRSGVEE